MEPCLDGASLPLRSGKSLDDVHGHAWPAARGPAADAAYAQLSSGTRTPRRGLGGPRMRLWDDVFSTVRQK